jgi:hypothetical protein
VVRVHPQGDILRLTAATRFPGEAPYWTETIVERVIPTGTWRFDAALWAKQAVALSGTSFIDGNNHDLKRNPVGLGFGHTSEHDKVAVRSMGNVQISGGGKIRGGGAPAANRGFPGLDGNYDVIDAEQNMAPDSAYSHTPADHFPTTPDQVIMSAEGRLIEIAERRGTYFQSEASFREWTQALPEHRLPPNSVIYLDFASPSPGMTLGSQLEWGQTLHIVVQHHPKTAETIAPKGGVDGGVPTAYVDADANGVPDTMLTAGVTGEPEFDGFGYVKTVPDGDSVIKALHGQFMGVLICDNLSNMNAQAEVYGGVASLQEDDNTPQNFANGRATVVYCSQAIDRAVAQARLIATSYRVLSFRTRPSTRDALVATELLGAPTTIPDEPEDAVDPDDSARTLDGWYEPAYPFEAPPVQE